MARETKIGLLAGLAFIICFAIILSQRGDAGKSTSIFRRSTQTTRNKPTRRNSMTSLIPLEQGKTNSTPNRPTPKGPGQLVTHTPANTQGPKADADDVDKFEPSGSGADVNLPTWVTTNGNSPETQPRTQPSLPPGRRRAGTVVNQQHGPASINSYPASAEQNRRLLEQRLADLNRTNQSANNIQPDTTNSYPIIPTSNASTFRYKVDRSPQTQSHRATPTSPSLSRPTATKIKGTHYTVVSGDSLSRIAGRHYGRQAHEFVDAIFNANRNVLSDPDSLKVGMKLILPDLKNSNQASNSRNMNRRKPTASKQSFRWYQIKENDSYVSISRDQLGNGRRWQEIYKLNRDKFPDPHRIRVGVRIKIPKTSGKMASGSRSGSRH